MSTRVVFVFGAMGTPRTTPIANGVNLGGLTFGTSYLNFSTATFVMRRNSIIHFDIDRAAVIDIGGTIIYGIVLTLQVWLFVRWQKRPTIEQAAAKAAESDGGEEPGGGPLARLRRRREKRVSAYGRPVTTEAT